LLFLTHQNIKKLAKGVFHIQNKKQANRHLTYTFSFPAKQPASAK